MKAASASITRLFVYVFPLRGPSRSQPVAWWCQFVLVSRGGFECPQPRLGLGRAVPRPLPWPCHPSEGCAAAPRLNPACGQPVFFLFRAK